MTEKLLSSVAFLSAFFIVSDVCSAEVPQALTIDRLSAETAAFLNNSQDINVHDAKTSETESYYRIKINEAKFGDFATHDTIKWEEIPASEKDKEVDNGGVILLNIPGEGVKYYHYSYNPDDYNNGINTRKLYTSRQTGLSGNGDIDADFIGNYNQTPLWYDGGGAINNFRATIGNITGDFISNYVQSTSTSTQAAGGAIYNFWSSKIGDITGNFIGNYAQSTSNYAQGGAIYNVSDFISIGNITGNFIGNYAQSTSNYAQGGAIYNGWSSTVENIINSNFIDNHANGSEESAGGAIYSNSNVLITADDGTSLFSGNMANDKSNAIYMDGADLTLSAVKNGVITFDDGIDGNNYNINISGDGTGNIEFYNPVENVANFTFSDNAIVHLGLNADIQAQNMSVASSGAISPQSASSPTIKVDVTFADNKQIKTGVINASDNLTGDYKVIANPLNKGSEDYIGASSVFLTAPNDEATFDLVRVNGSPYVWGLNKDETETGFDWAIKLTDYEEPEDNKPDDNKPDDNEPSVKPVVSEVIAGEGLHEAAIEQTRSVVRNVRSKVAAGREYCPNCGVYSAEWDGEKLRNIWVTAQGETATIDKPVKMDADIWGVEAGFDVQNDVNNTLGVFASYRKGEYDLSGKAAKVRSTIGSEIDIDSYLAGLYYRYDKNMNRLFATVYGGIQQADAKTDDGIAKFDTDGVEFGASVEAGHSFALSSDLTLDPSVGLYYTQINFDDAKDNVGKEYSWKDIKHLEAELGVKLEKQIDCAKIYVKPSVIQTVTGSDSVKITGLNRLNTYDDGTLGRIELGGRYGFTDALSAYGWVNYTFGSNYDATAFGAGVNYAW